MDTYNKLSLLLNSNPMFVDNMTTEELKNFISIAEEIYYNSDLDSQESILDDKVYDYIKDAYAMRTPQKASSATSATSVSDLDHVPMPKGRLIDLPIYLGGMIKMNHGDGKLLKWKVSYGGQGWSYVVSAKMDGASAIYIDNFKMMSRGKNMKAQDLSPMLEYLNLPKIEKDIMVRGELIVRKSVFASKYKKSDSLAVQHLQYKNSRNAISGLVNSVGSGGVIDPINGMINDVNFVAYEVITLPPMKSEDQMKYLEERGFNVVKYEIVSDVNDDILSSKYDEYLETLDYDTDGLIVCSNQIYYRPKDRNPEYIKAYKKPLEILTGITTITDIEWNCSRFGKWIPTILLEPVKIDNTTISRVTGNNARNIMNCMMFKGAIVKIIRSGGVIPKIIDVIKPAEQSDIKFPPNNYKWNDTNVNFVVETQICDSSSLSLSSSSSSSSSSSQFGSPDRYDVTRDMVIKRLTYFASSVGAKGFGEITVGKLYDRGFADIKSLLTMCLNPLSHPPSPASPSGLGGKTHVNLVESMTLACSTVTLSTLMASVSVFSSGLGTKKFDILLDHLGHVLDRTTLSQTGGKPLPVIHGFGDITFDNLSSNLPKFIDLVLSFPDEILYLFKKISVNKELNRISELIEKPSHVLKVHKNPVIDQKHFCFTGFRDIALSKFVQDNGGIMDTTMTSKTNVLVIKDSSYRNKKTSDAEMRGVTIMSRDELNRMSPIV